MRWLVLTAAVLGTYGLPVQDDAAKKDLAAVQGTWNLVAMDVDGKAVVVWPKSQQQAEPVLPLPKGTTYSYK